MGLFDFIEKAQQKVIEQQENIKNRLAAFPNEATEAMEKKIKTFSKRLEETPEKIVQKFEKKPKIELAVESINKQIFAQRDNIRKNGFTEYEFIANRDCCEICAELNGKHFSISELQIGVNAPPMHEGCKCSIAAYEDSAEYEAWLDFISKGGTTKQWEAMKRKNAKRG